MQGSVVDDAEAVAEGSEAEMSSSNASDGESDLDEGEQREKLSLEIRELKKANKKLRKELEHYKEKSDKLERDFEQYKTDNPANGSGEDLGHNQPAMPVITEDPRAKRFQLGMGVPWIWTRCPLVRT